MFTASNDQPTSFPTACSNKKSYKPNKAQKPKNPIGLGFFKNPGISEPWLHVVGQL